VGLFMLAPVVEDAHRAKAELCDGELDFVFVIDAAGKVRWTRTPPFTEEVVNRNSFAKAAVRELIDGAASDGDLVRHTRAELEPTIMDLRQLQWNAIAEATMKMRAALPPTTTTTTTTSMLLDGLLPVMPLVPVGLYGGAVVERLASCDTEFIHYDPWNVEILMAAVGVPVAICADVKPYCGNLSIAGLRARQYCPLTCGCSALSSGLLLYKPDQGCGTACYKAQMANLWTTWNECSQEFVSQRTPDELRLAPDWMEYSKQLAGLGHHYLPRLRDLLVATSALMLEIGCDIVGYVKRETGGAMDPCSFDAWPFTPLIIICPTTCDSCAYIKQLDLRPS